MTECSHPELGRMLHHYELGMLSDDKRRAFEEHLFECNYCFEAAKQSREVANILSQDEEVREAVRDVASEHSDTETERETALRPAPRRVYLKRYWPIAAAAALFLVFLLSDWQLELRPTKEAVAHLDRLAVMYFENVADPSDSLRTGEIITNLLITDLSESQYMGVVSSQRLYDVLKYLGKEGQKQIDRDVATEVATRADARWMLIGSILQMEPHIEITSRLIDVESGSIIASQKMSGDEGEDVFNVVDRLTVAIKSELPLPPAAFQEPDRPVVELTTTSPEAYRLYVEALDLYYRAQRAEARKLLYKAVDLDSTFAMAYARLAFLTEGTRRPLMITKALQYAERVSERERSQLLYMREQTARHYDSAAALLERLVETYPDDKEAYLNLGQLYRYHLWQPRKAITCSHSVLELDPQSAAAYNLVAYAYSDLEQHDSALWAIDRCLELAPNEPNYLNSRGDVHYEARELDKAAESYRMALEIDPGFSQTLRKLGRVYTIQGQYERADSAYRLMAAHPDAPTRADGRHWLAMLEEYRGRFDKALERFETGIQMDSIELGDAWAGSRIWKYWRRFQLKMWVLEDTAAALADVKALENLAARVDTTTVGYVRLFRFAHIAVAGLNAKRGDEEAARLGLERLHASYDTLSEFDMTAYAQAGGILHFLLENYDSAITYFERMTWRGELGAKTVNLAFTYRSMGRFADAIPLYEQWNRKYFGEWISVLVYHELAQCYEGVGRTREAIDAYELFLEHWGECTPQIERVRHARRRVALLKSGGA